MLDTRFAGLAGDNRWNAAGQPTLYLASDLGVVLAEFARHLRDERGLSSRQSQARSVYRLGLRLSAVLDLRQPRVRGALGLQGGARRFLDRRVARATAQYVRTTTPIEAVLVPPMAFLDDPTRSNLVLFLEKLPADLSSFITATFEGDLRLDRPIEDDALGRSAG